MKDLDLLESAAHAAGIYYWLEGATVLTHGETPGSTREWNPLLDDGDAMRLAVKMGLNVDIRPGIYVEASYLVEEASRCLRFEEKVMQDPYAATRRAIVRATAAMAGVRAVRDA